ncbi:MAG: MMPL family transporter [Lutibacter sp.]|uniref:efflux RND transporter permease subunit n=1 Tax=Lutibacter sp. TaxID=1925666 RepID=UPI001A0A18AB|nr:MMPL family transporter [Lutibacter sp.]NOR27277.1 MMPL family transporter [Lutibacter sp.]
MKNQQNRETTFFNKVTSNYKVILVLSALLLISVAVFIPKMTKDTRMDAFLPKDDAVLVFRNQVKETFGLKDPMVIAIVNENKDGIFNKKTLQLVYELGEKIKNIPGIDPDQITSLATENNIVGTDEGILVDLFYEIDELTDEKAKEVKLAINNFELYQGSLVSKDGTTTLIVAEMLDSYDRKQHEVYNNLVELLEEYKSYDEDLYLAGEGAISGYLVKYIDEDAMKTNPFAALIISIILIIGYRTVRGVVLPNLMVLASVGIALGAMAAFGVDFFVITNGLPVVLIAIAVADGIHVLGEYYETVAKYPKFSQKELVVHTMVKMWRPITITSLTTVSGFIAIAASSYMPPMTYFGIFGALGVTVALVYALFMLPSALMLLKPQKSKAFKSNQEIDWFGKRMEILGKVVIKHPKTIVILAIIIVGLGINGASKLIINENRIKSFQSEEPIVAADNIINSKTDGTAYLDIFIETPKNEDIFKIENLQKMEAMQTYIETLPHVKGSTSIVDFLKKMNQSLNENKEEAYKLPETKDLAAQYLLLYSASGDPTDFDNYVDYDYRLANIRFRMETAEYLKEKYVIDKTNEYIAKHFTGASIKATPSGKVTVDTYWINRLGYNHFLGAGIALFVVFIVAALSFRSLVAGALTIIPVLISVLFIYTVMGLMGIWLAVGTSMFAAIAIGVGVDFAVHTVDRLKYLLKEKGLPIQEAYQEFYKSAGRALLFNFLALALGFGVLMTSSVPPLNQFGFLVAIAVMVSFIGSLTLLPAIIYLTNPKFLRVKK